MVEDLAKMVGVGFREHARETLPSSGAKRVAEDLAEP
jgi:hypothetical protein